MSTFRIAGMGAAVAIIGILAVIGERQSVSDRETAIEIYAIAEDERPLMRACEDAFGTNEIEFRHGVERLDGCGCMTRQIADTAERADYPTVSEILAVIVRFGADDLTDTEMASHLTEIRDTHQWTTSKVGDTTDRVARAIAYCGQPEQRRGDGQRAGVGPLENVELRLAQSDR